ncbi:MAG: hypothetical protein E6J91_26380, partial [Deltaproteobacteria bacterium]
MSMLGVHAGCLREASQTCANGGVCPPGLQCIETQGTTPDGKICVVGTCGNGRLDRGEVCDDGNNRSGDGCPADCMAPCGDGVLDPGEACDDCSTVDGLFLVSPQVVTFMATEGDVVPAAVAVAVRLPHRDDAVAAGFAPTWLSLTSGPRTANTAEFELRVTDTSMVGERSTSVRFTISHQSSTGPLTFDLPIVYHVAASDLALQATPGTLAFMAVGGGAAPPPRSVSVTFNGANASVVSAPSWVAVSSPAPATSPAAFAVSIINTSFSPGTVLSGDVVLGTTQEAFQRVTAVHVSYSLVASAPEVQFVAPYVGIAGRGGTLRVRGPRFPMSGYPVTVSLGDLQLDPAIPDGDTQVTVGYPPLPEGRYPVNIADPPGVSPTGAELVIVAPPPSTYQAIDAPRERTRLVYDAERQAIYGVNQSDQQIEHFAYRDGSWSAVSPHVIPSLMDIAMTPDGRSLIVFDPAAIYEISLTDDRFVAAKRADIPEPSCGDFFMQAAAANNGKIFAVTQLSECSGSAPTYLYDVLDHSIFQMDLLYFGTSAASGDGSRIYAGTTNGAQPMLIFDSLSGTTSTSFGDVNVGLMSVGGDASRVILDGRDVYDRALRLTGHLPSFRGPALASRDSSRAFMYVQEGATAHLEVYDLNGALQSGGLYPLLKTVM